MTNEATAYINQEDGMSYFGETMTQAFTAWYSSLNQATRFDVNNVIYWRHYMDDYRKAIWEYTKHLLASSGIFQEIMSKFPV